MKSQGSNEILLKGTVGSDGLYQFPSLLQNSAESSSKTTFQITPFHSAVNNSHVNTTTANAVSFSTRHARLGHPSADVDVQRKVFQYCNIPLINKNASDFCSSCCMGKTHLLHSSLSHTT